MSERIDQIAIRVIEIFLLRHELFLTGDYEVRDYGRHRVWEVSAWCNGIIQATDFWYVLSDYLDDYGQHCPACYRFQPYDVKVYPGAVGGTSNIYMSIYQ